jgi:hypothetical protein
MQNDCGPGEACDIGPGNPFTCFPPPNNVSEGGYCGQNGPYCLNGLVCVNSQCARYCCDAGDCGGSSCAYVATLGTIDVLACF